MQLRESSVKLLRLQAVDGQDLDALLYDSPSADPKTALVHLHGKGLNFLSGPGRFIPPRLPRVLHLALNMRFRDLAFAKGDVRDAAMHEEIPGGVGGGFWERTKDGSIDISAAVDYLRGEKGVENVILVGHSSGGFHAASYAAEDPDVARILISPLTSSRTAFARWFPSKAEQESVVRKAQTLIDQGRGGTLILLPRWYFAISADSLIERLSEPENFWIDKINQSSSPVMMIWGKHESRHPLWTSLFDQIRAPQRAAHAIDGAEHYFIGFEQQVVDAIDGFLAHIS